MARRTKDWNKGLADDLRNRKFTLEFLMAAIEEGIPLQHALAKSCALRESRSSLRRSAWRARTCYAPSILAITRPRQRSTAS